MADINKEATTTPKAKKEKTVTIRLPRKKGEDSVWVSVNMRSWQIQRGVDVEVPACVAEVLRHQDEMLAIIDAFDEERAARL